MYRHTNQCCKRKIVKQIRKDLPDIGITIPAKTKNLELSTNAQRTFNSPIMTVFQTEETSNLREVQLLHKLVQISTKTLPDFDKSNITTFSNKPSLEESTDFSGRIDECTVHQNKQLEKVLKQSSYRNLYKDPTMNHGPMRSKN